MYMELNFPHPRRAAKAGTIKADYSALVASATSRQAVSQTVGALLSATPAGDGTFDSLDSRIAFFAGHGATNRVRGAFWLLGSAKVEETGSKFELAVNLSDSVDGNSEQSSTIKPEYQVAERGTEL